MIAEEEYEESMYDQRSALKRNNDASKLLSGRILNSINSSIVASPETKASTGLAIRRELPEVKTRRSINREKSSLSISE